MLIQSIDLCTEFQKNLMEQDGPIKTSLNFQWVLLQNLV